MLVHGLCDVELEFWKSWLKCVLVAIDLGKGIGLEIGIEQVLFQNLWFYFYLGKQF